MTQPAFAVELAIGPEAEALLGDASFLAAWTALHADCAHATAFQSPAFALAWYEAYRPRYQPVVARGLCGGAELEGLWLLAYDAARAELVHVGGHQAEYHVWLARPAHEDRFLDAAWRALRRRLPFRALRFKYLPAPSLAAKLGAIPSMAGRITARLHGRPLWKLDADGIRAIFAKKGNRNRLNRLRDLGALEFRRVTEPAQLEAILDDFIAFYDFRQGAVNRTTPFRDDPLKRAFYTRLLAAAPRETSVTASFLAGKAIAMCWCVVSGRVAHLGMLTHLPTLGRHSPGRMHLLQLARHLLAEGQEVIDLTPGGDEWKAKIANDADEVPEVILHRSGASRLRAETAERVLQWGRRCAARVGVAPARLRGALARMRRATPAALARKLRAWARSDREFRIYRGDRDFAGRFAVDPRVARNCFADLVRFEPGEAWQSRDAFLASALERIERGDTAYTLCVDGRLAHCGWLARHQSESRASEVQQTLAMPTGSFALYDYYTHPDFRGRGLYRAAIGHMLREALQDAAMRHAYISVLADNAPSRHVIESLGFEYQGSLHWKCRFGRVTRWADPRLAGAARGHE